MQSDFYLIYWKATGKYGIMEVEPAMHIGETKHFFGPFDTENKANEYYKILKEGYVVASRYGEDGEAKPLD